jgi:hypothetical protein
MAFFAEIEKNIIELDFDPSLGRRRWEGIR